ncbi:unnamed protein product, partial [Thlaspi arvense]
AREDEPAAFESSKDDSVDEAAADRLRHFVSLAHLLDLLHTEFIVSPLRLCLIGRIEEKFIT